TAVDERYGLFPASNTGVIPDAKQGSVPAPYGTVCQQGQNLAACEANPLKAPNGSLPKPFLYADGTPVNVILPNIARQPVVLQSNPTWGAPTAFQPVRQFRFSLRATF